MRRRLLTLDMIENMRTDLSFTALKMILTLRRAHGSIDPLMVYPLGYHSGTPPYALLGVSAPPATQGGPMGSSCQPEVPAARHDGPVLA